MAYHRQSQLQGLAKPRLGPTAYADRKWNPERKLTVVLVRPILARASC